MDTISSHPIDILATSCCYVGFFCLILVSYSEDVPHKSPPSYKGQAVRFSYKITIGIGSIKGPTKLLRLPIRVISTEG